MPKFNRDERIVLCVILIGAGLLLAITSGGFMVLASALDGLDGMGNPSAEMQKQSHQDSIFRNLVLICLIAGGGVIAFLGFMMFPRSKADVLTYHNPEKDTK